MCFDFQLHEPFSPKPNLFHFSKLCPDARYWSPLTLLAYSTTFLNPFLIHFPNLLLTNKYKKITHQGLIPYWSKLIYRIQEAPNLQRKLQVLFHKWDTLLHLLTDRKLTSLLLNQKYWLAVINTKPSIPSKANYLLFSGNLWGSSEQAGAVLRSALETENGY